MLVICIASDSTYEESLIVSNNGACDYHRSDSLAWNPHKALTVPLQCSGFITKHKGLLAQCNSAHANYLFQQDKCSYDVSYDTGDKSIQCGRLNDAFKMWLIWKAKVCMLW